MPISLSTLERAAASGPEAIGPALAVLLDELEALGELTHDIEQIHARMDTIARKQQVNWARCPEAAIIDFYARTLDLPALARSRVRWQLELDARGPWLRPLRPRPNDEGPVAEIEGDDACDLLTFGRPRFLSDEHVALEPRVPGSVAQRSVWAWREGTVALEHWQVDAPNSNFPRFERADAGPLMYRSADGPPEHLPWPHDANASAHASLDGTRIFVYGSGMHYRGLVRVLDIGTLEVVREHGIGRRVYEVHERPGTDELLIVTSEEVIAVDADDDLWVLATGHRHVACSPSGKYLCVVSSGLAQIHELDKPRQRPNFEGLPCFSPDGARLVDGDMLLDGRTGAAVARLVGGPSISSYHVGTELIVAVPGADKLWRTTTGEPIEPGAELPATSWSLVCFDASGTRYALADQDQWEVTIGELPSMQSLATIGFGIDVASLALSPDGSLIAARGDQRLEVRRLDGTLVLSEVDDTAGAHPRFRHWPQQLSFSPDGRALICEDRLQHRDRILSFGEQAAEPTSEWSIDASVRWGDPFTRFVHTSGAQITVLHKGPWLVNPRAPNIYACPGALFELRGT